MTDDLRDSTRARIVECAARLLTDGGPTEVTTRAVAAAAGVQAPTIYRLFGDKDGLLDAVAEHVLGDWVARKRVRTDIDPVDEFRASFEANTGFGLANPGVWALMSDPLRPRPAVTARGIAVLRARVHRLALAGRLRVPEDLAVDLVHAMGTGLISGLLDARRQGHDEDHATALARTTWEVLAGVLLTDDRVHDGGPDGGSDAGTADATTAAVRLRADDDALGVLSPAEQTLMREWLDRIAARRT